MYYWGVLLKQKFRIMKTTVLLLLISLPFFAQHKEQVPKTIEIYNHTMGVREILPTKIIEIYEDRIETYNVNFGIKELTPNEVIIDNKVYDIRFGIQDILPKKEIVVEEIEIIED